MRDIPEAVEILSHALRGAPGGIEALVTQLHPDLVLEPTRGRGTGAEER